MIELVIAAALSVTDAQRATCTLEAEGNRRRITGFVAQCADEDVQAAADALLARVALPARGDATFVFDDLTLVHFNGRWDLEKPVTLVGMDYGRWRGGGRSQRNCSGTARILPDGTLANQNWVCAVINWRGNLVDGTRPAERLESISTDTRWMLPARFEEGCLESSVWLSGVFRGDDMEARPAPEIDPVLRPSCDAFAFHAVYFDHPLMMPIEAAPAAVTAICTAGYDYDSAGFTAHHWSDCTPLSMFGNPLDRSEPSEVAILKAAFEARLIEYLSRTRRAPAQPEFDGLRQWEQEFEFNWGYY